MLRPRRKSVPTETRHPMQKSTAILPKMCSQELSKKSIKRGRKNNPFLNIIFHSFAAPALLGRFVPFLACGVAPPM